jgi:malate permease and related proteins
VTDLASVFVQVIVPVLLIGGLGYALGMARRMDVAPITAVAVMVLIPGVVFDSLTRAVLPGALLGRLVIHVVLQLIALGAIALLAARLAGWRGPAQAGFLLASLWSNTGSTGLPIALFAFGAPGLAIAGGWFAASSVVGHTVGVYIAARSRADASAALRRLATMPILYAIGAGIVIKVLDWPLPAPVAKASQLLASGSVAVLLLLAGLQLARLRPRAEAGATVLATFVRLVVAPAVAWLTGRAVGLEGLALSVAVLQASMPTAVIAALWAIEFDTRPALVTATVVFSTLASVITLTVLLTMLL